MQIQIRVFRNAECLSNNSPCLRESIEVDDFASFPFEKLTSSFKYIWPDSLITINI